MNTSSHSVHIAPQFETVVSLARKQIFFFCKKKREKIKLLSKKKKKIFVKSIIQQKKKLRKTFLKKIFFFCYCEGPKNFSAECSFSQRFFYVRGASFFFCESFGLTFFCRGKKN